jgi:hypothetical protein
MFREMLKKKQLLTKEESIKILEECTAGVLGVMGDDNYPYTVPMSYSLKGERLFFHCAKIGHKIDAIKNNDKVTFCVIGNDEIIQETFSTNYTSVIIFGRARILADDFEKRYALESLIEKYSPDYVEEGQKEIEKDWDRVCLIEVKIEHMTGKTYK